MFVPLFSQVIRKILKHLDLWDVKRKPPARSNAPPPETLIFYDESPSPPRAEHYLNDPDYPVETYL
jgi:hypothetical protein